ncbi:MAG: His/Gly/Thr/Pro-type tRNA ligase C-terminal domain-containing protein, partial [Pseudomonadota bacterium]
AFNIKFLSKLGVEEFVWTTSWGVSTRLIGGLIMTHSDDNGLILPPKIAPIQVIIIPLIHKQENREAILEYCNKLKEQLGSDIRVDIDLQEKTSGEKIWGWIKKGVPIRLEIGQKEVENNAVFMGRRDLDPKEKTSLDVKEFIAKLANFLEDIQKNIFEKAKKFLNENSYIANSKEEFFELFKNEEKSGFVSAYWIGDNKTEEELKQELKVTARCIALSTKTKTGKCIFTGKENAPLTTFARAY